MPYMGPIPYPSGPFYPPYPVPPPKPGEPYYPGFYLTPVPHPPPGNGQDPENVNVGYPPPHSQFYPTTFLAPYAQHYPPAYMMQRPDGQMQMQPSPYAYPPMYGKPPSAAGPSMDNGAGGMHMGGRREDQPDGGRGDGLMGLDKAV